MLREMSSVRQTEENSRAGIIKRWFSSADVDLFVWQQRNQIVAFHLSYGKLSDELAVAWKIDEPLQYFRVDDGWEPGNYPRSPILIKQEAPEDLSLSSVLVQLNADLQIIDNDLAQSLQDLLSSVAH